MLAQAMQNSRLTVLGAGYVGKALIAIPREMAANMHRDTGDLNEFWAGRDYLNRIGPLRAATLMAHAARAGLRLHLSLARYSTTSRRARLPSSPDTTGGLPSRTE